MLFIPVQGGIMVRHTAIFDSGLFSPLFISSFFLHILSFYLLLSSPLPKPDTPSVEEGQNVFQMTFSWQLVCPLISLTRLAMSGNKGRGLSLSVLNFFVSFFLSVCLSENTLLSLFTLPLFSFHSSIISSRCHTSPVCFSLT